MTEKRWRHRGMSLIEMMVSMGVGLVILSACMTVLGYAGDSYGRMAERVAVDREARQAMRQLAEDFSASLHEPAGIYEESAAIWPVDRMGFCCLKSERSQSGERYVGDLCAVTYEVKDVRSGGKVERCLMRTLRDSAEAYEAMTHGGGSAMWNAHGLRDEPLSSGVVSFRVRPLLMPKPGEPTPWHRDNGCGPDAIEVLLVLARRGLSGHLIASRDWDQSPRLGDPGNADRHPGLKTYRAIFTRRCHACP